MRSGRKVTWTLDGNECFDGMNFRSENKVTAISGIVADQAALHGSPVRLRDYALVLISIKSG